MRQEVPAGQIAWDTSYDVYDPIAFTAPHVLKAPWADPKIGHEGFHPQWNQMDGLVNRQSHEGVYRVKLTPFAFKGNPNHPCLSLDFRPQ